MHEGVRSSRITGRTATQLEEDMMKLATALLASAMAFGMLSAAQAGEIAVIVKTVNSTFWQNVQKGADAAMKDV